MKKIEFLLVTLILGVAIWMFGDIESEGFRVATQGFVFVCYSAYVVHLILIRKLNIRDEMFQYEDYFQENSKWFTNFNKGTTKEKVKNLNLIVVLLRTRFEEFPQILFSTIENNNEILSISYFDRRMECSRPISLNEVILLLEKFCREKQYFFVGQKQKMTIGPENEIYYGYNIQVVFDFLLKIRYAADKNLSRNSTPTIGNAIPRATMLDNFEQTE